jgi:hypothetical protein
MGSLSQLSPALTHIRDGMPPQLRKPHRPYFPIQALLSAAVIDMMN